LLRFEIGGTNWVHLVKCGQEEFEQFVKSTGVGPSVGLHYAIGLLLASQPNLHVSRPGTSVRQTAMDTPQESPRRRRSQRDIEALESALEKAFETVSNVRPRQKTTSSTSSSHAHRTQRVKSTTQQLDLERVVNCAVSKIYKELHHENAELRAVARKLHNEHAKLREMFLKLEQQSSPTSCSSPRSAPVLPDCAPIPCKSRSLDTENAELRVANKKMAGKIEKFRKAIEAIDAGGPPPAFAPETNVPWPWSPRQGAWVPSLDPFMIPASEGKIKSTAKVDKTQFAARRCIDRTHGSLPVLQLQSPTREPRKQSRTSVIRQRGRSLTPRETVSSCRRRVAGSLAVARTPDTH